MATRILIVEDTHDIRDALVITFTEAGFRVAAAERGEEAFEELATFTPDIVLLDMHLPGMSGIEILKKMRTSLTVPILMYTNSSAIETVKDAIRSGATDYVLKETGMDGLIDRVNRHLVVPQPGQKPNTASIASIDAGQPLQVLYVGEDANMIRLVGDTARRLAVESTHVRTAKVALGRVGKGSAAIVVTELKLRDSGGLSLLKAINSEQKAAPTVPVIIVADAAPPEKRRSALGLNAAGFYIKPVSAIDFEQLVRSLIGQVRKARAA